MRKQLLFFFLISVCLIGSCKNNEGKSYASFIDSTKTAGGNISNRDNNAANTVTTNLLTPNAAGKMIFQQKCAACHGLNGNARNNNAANLQYTRLDSLSITQTIKSGRGTMPPFKDALADSDIAHLAIYVISIRQ